MNRKPRTKISRTTIWGLAAFIENEVNLHDFSLLIRDKKNADIKQVAVILIEAKQKLNRVILQ
ncbi:hypothetical protein [Gracilimonas tropica]|uniref:hypothetical protein n=1 Tax=Gracilimonas tropica TaxID=454600 RepID=UPI00035E39ED|nr:hypothetical protein [Gracilimonas tropica]